MNERRKQYGAILAFMAMALCIVLYPWQVLNADPLPEDIADRITDITGLLPEEIDQIFAAEQAAALVLIPYDITIPIVLEPRTGYLLVRVAATGQWIRVLIGAEEWASVFRPYLESLGVVINRQPNGTIDILTAAEEAAQIAAEASISGSETANLVLYGQSVVAAGDTTIYEYDALGRLTKASHSSQVSTAYCYDEAGNRVAVISSSGIVEDCPVDPPLGQPGDLSVTTHAGAGYTVSWSAVSGATHYNLKFGTGTYPVINDPNQTTYSTGSNTLDDEPVWIQACNYTECSAKVFF